MSIPRATEVDLILGQIESWPPSDRRYLARRILEALESPPQPPPRPTPTRPLTDLIGLIKLDAPPPTDEECEAMLEQKYMP